jgi:hypothetical protein
MTPVPDDRPQNKVARLIEKYELTGLGAELEARWTGDGVERTSLRDLANQFNQRLLAAALEEAGRTPLDDEVVSLYENLTGDDVSQGVKTDTRTSLAADGIDIDTLERDFVTYQAIRSYLQNWRGAEYRQPSDEEKLDSDRETIQRLLTRTLTVTEDRLEQLRETERIAAADFEVFVDAQVLCQRCGTRYTAVEFIDNGGCDCLQDTE